MLSVFHNIEGYRRRVSLTFLPFCQQYPEGREIVRLLCLRRPCLLDNWGKFRFPDTEDLLRPPFLPRPRTLKVLKGVGPEGGKGTHGSLFFGSLWLKDSLWLGIPHLSSRFYLFSPSIKKLPNPVTERKSCYRPSYVGNTPGHDPTNPLVDILPALPRPWLGSTRSGLRRGEEVFEVLPGFRGDLRDVED